MTDTGQPTEDMRVKYSSRNPIVRWMVDGFLRNLDQLVGGLDAGNLLDIGCGEGFLTNRWRGRKPAAFVCGMDTSPAVLAIARQRFASVPFFRGTVYGLPYRDRALDLVIACEVLEHLTDPEAALGELRRVTRRHIILTVPQEPLWRMLNVARGQYLSAWGNTPDHRQHWRPAAFRRLVSRYFAVREMRTPLPWTMVLAERR